MDNVENMYGMSGRHLKAAKKKRAWIGLEARQSNWCEVEAGANRCVKT